MDMPSGQFFPICFVHCNYNRIIYRKEYTMYTCLCDRNPLRIKPSCTITHRNSKKAGRLLHFYSAAAFPDLYCIFWLDIMYFF